MGFNTGREEYKALLNAQRTLTIALQPRKSETGEDVWIEPRDAAMVASALTRVIDQKRVMRGQPAPKPIDLSQTKRKRKPDSGWIDPSAQPPGPAQ